MQAENDFDHKVHEIFLDQFGNEAIEIRNCIESLKSAQGYEKSVNTLFRIFHSLKANSRYFQYTEIEKLAIKVESVLSALRDTPPPLSRAMQSWLEAVLEQYQIWVDELDDGVLELSEADKQLLEKVERVDTQRDDPLSLLKRSKLHYFHGKKQISWKLLSFLEKFTKEVVLVQDLTELKTLTASEKIELCIIDAKESSPEAVKALSKYAPTAAMIVFLDTSDIITRKKLMIQRVHNIVKYPIKANELKREMITVAESHFGTKKFVIDNKEIEEFIFKLKGFPEAINRIQDICNDSEASIKELIKEVKQDPVIAGIVLQEVKNPLYNLPDIKTIDKAVSLLGKKYVRAVVMKQVHNHFDFTDLSLYKLSFNQFSDVATKRYFLMLKWYSKVSIAALEILSTTAMLGNLGQLLIAKEVANGEKEEEFTRLMKQHSIEHAEHKVVHTTTARVSSDIFSFWNFDRDVIDSVRFSDNPQNAPTEVFDLALANYVVYHLVPLNGEIATAIPKKMQRLLEDRNLKVETLQNALNSVLELTQ
ncbi:MAG: HDOD domain-containing protein [Sulfurimonas sp.]